MGRWPKERWDLQGFKADLVGKKRCATDACDDCETTNGDQRLEAVIQHCVDFFYAMFSDLVK